jgi:signal recognition particle receptor subunit beta
MSTPSSDTPQVTARIIYWGIEGAGKSTCLQTIHAKLKADKRGELRQLPTRLDPTVTYDEMPIELGTLNGVHTQLRLIAVPGAPALSHTRKQLLDCVDGVVLVLDSRADQLDANLESVQELRESLDAYGRTLETIPLVVQYNLRDLGDPFAIEELHRRIGIPDAAVFETVANGGTGILQALTTISKRVVRTMRERNLEPEPVASAAPIAQQAPAAQAPPAAEPLPIAKPLAPAPATPTPVAEAASSASVMEAAILAEGEGMEADLDPISEAQRALDRPWSELQAEAKRGAGARIGSDLRIVSVGTATRSGERAVQVPLVLGNDEGETVTLSLSVQLDPLLDDEAT